MPDSRTDMGHTCWACGDALAAVVNFCPFCGEVQSLRPPPPPEPPVLVAHTSAPEPASPRPAAARAEVATEERPVAAAPSTGNGRQALVYACVAAPVLAMLAWFYGYLGPQSASHEPVADTVPEETSTRAPPVHAPKPPAQPALRRMEIRAPADRWSDPDPQLLLHAGDSYVIDSDEGVLVRDRDGGAHPVLSDQRQHIYDDTQLQFQSAGKNQVYFWIYITPADRSQTSE